MALIPASVVDHYEKRIKRLARDHHWANMDASGNSFIHRNMVRYATEATKIDFTIFNRTVVTLKNNNHEINYGPTPSWFRFYLITEVDGSASTLINWHALAKKYNVLGEALDYWCNRIIANEFVGLSQQMRQEVYAMSKQGYERFRILRDDPKLAAKCNGIEAIDKLINRYVQIALNVPDATFYVWNIGGVTQYNITCVRNS